MSECLVMLKIRRNIFCLFILAIVANVVICDEESKNQLSADNEEFFQNKDEANKEVYEDEVPSTGLELEHEIVDEQADQPTSGERFVAIHVNKMGAKEELNPTLVGLSNIAITFLPKNYKLLNVISAFREVVTGVRFNLIVNATNENDIAVICELNVLEKPWIITEWGDKLRTLEYSNCSSIGADAEKKPPYNSKDFNFNPLFVNKYSAMSDDLLKALEAQIIRPKSTTTTTTTTERVIEPSLSDSAKNILDELFMFDTGSGNNRSDNNLHELSSTEKPVDNFNEQQNFASVSFENNQNTEETFKIATDNLSPIPVSSTQTSNLNNNVGEKIENKNIFRFYEFVPASEFYNLPPQTTELPIEKEVENVLREFVESNQEITKAVYDIVKLEIDLKSQTLQQAIAEDETLKQYIKEALSNTAQEQQYISNRIKDTYNTPLQTYSTPFLAPQIQSIVFHLADPNVEQSNIIVRETPAQQDNYKVAVTTDSNSEGQIHVRNDFETEINVQTYSAPENEQQFLDHNTQARKKRDTMGYISELVQRTLHQFDEIETHEYKPIALEIMEANQIESDKDIYYNLKLKLGYSHCTEESTNVQNCLKNIVDSADVCRFQVKVTDDTSNLIDYECSPEKRQKRQTLVGAPVDISTNDEEAEKLVKEALTTLSSQGENGASYSFYRLKSVSRQVVAGVLYKISAEFKLANDEIESCSLEIWDRPWIKVDGREVKMTCGENKKYEFRQKRSLILQPLETPIKSNYEVHVEDMFHKFKLKYNRQYGSAMENDMRLRIFKNNLFKIDQLNKYEQGTAKYGITVFTDYTSAEYKQRTGLIPRKGYGNEISNPIADIPDIDLPRDFDWRSKGVITEVKDQGNCGSCWAFSVTGNIEGLHAIKYGVLEEYSEQELVDCDTVDSGCNGGLPDNAYKAIEQIGGLELESAYPYSAKKKECLFNKTLSHVNVKGAVDLPQNETAMALWLVQNGPLSIGINANAMQFYRGGVSHPLRLLCRHSSIDHGVLIVGYGIAEYPLFNKTLPYWIVKNSWGPKWGEQGYYRVFKGDNTCGISSMVSSAVLE